MKRKIARMLVAAIGFTCCFGNGMYTQAEETDDIVTLGAVPSDSIITEVEEPEDSELSSEYKLSLKDQVNQLPDTVLAEVNPDGENVDSAKNVMVEVPVTWECVQDYDEDLDSYDFVPVIDDLEVADNVKLPTVTVEIENNGDMPKGLLREAGDNIDVPVLSENTKGKPIDEASLGSSYNSQKKGKLPALRDQNPYGTCWAFSAIGAVEADMIASGYSGKNINLSEYALAYFATHDYDDPKNCHDNDDVYYCGSNYLDNGGCHSMGWRSFSNLVGCVPESKVPYTNASANSSLDSKYAVKNNSVNIENAYQISTKDRAGIKAAIKDHGGVSASISMDDSCYSSTYNSLCTTNSYCDHAIMLVGWNDNFSKNNFKDGCKPKKNGAWLVRNSWGSYGDEYNKYGYFWLSYYDKAFYTRNYVVAYDAVPIKYDYCYSYDSEPIYEYYYNYIPNGSTVKQYFTVGKNELIKTVGFENYNKNVRATVTVKAGKVTATGTVKTSYPGYYTVDLNRSIKTTKTTSVHVSIKYVSDDGSNIKVATEDPGSFWYGDTYYCPETEGKAYYKSDRLDDVRMKLYTTSTKRTSKAAQKITASVKTSTIAKGKKVSINVKGAKGKLTFKSSNKNIATVSNTGVVTGKAGGKVTITVSAAATSTYNKSANKTVTIKVRPGAPTSISAVSISKGMKVSWKRVAGAHGYYVFRNGVVIKKVQSGKTTSIKDLKANRNGAKYVYKVKAYNKISGQSANYKVVTAYRLNRTSFTSLASRRSNRISAKWRKNPKCTGYQINCSTSSNFKQNKKLVSVKGRATLGKTITGLKRGKTYYVRVRAFKRVKGKNYYSAWSTVKKVRVK